MAYLEELLSEFREGVKIRRSDWGINCYIQLHERNIITQSENDYKLTNEDIVSDKWELYIEPIDWERIIYDRCLCWLWDDNFKWAICGTLANVEKGSEYRFIMSDDAGNRSSYKHCRPVRRDEVNFYEEKE